MRSRFARFHGTTSEDVWVGGIQTFLHRSRRGGRDPALRRQVGRGFRGVAFYDVRRPGRPRLLSGSRPAGRPAASTSSRWCSAPTAACSRSLRPARMGGDARAARRARRRGDRSASPAAPRDLGLPPERPTAGPPAAAEDPQGRGELIAHSVFPFDGGRGVRLALGRRRGLPGSRESCSAALPRPHALPGRRLRERALGVVLARRTDPRPERRGRRLLPRGRRPPVGLPAHLRRLEPRPAGAGRELPHAELASRSRRPRPPGRDLLGTQQRHRRRRRGRLVVLGRRPDRQPREPAPPAPRGALRAAAAAGSPSASGSRPTVPRASPHVWGVAVADGLVYASDINSGLWVIRARPIPAGASGPPR